MIIKSLNNLEDLPNFCLKLYTKAIIGIEISGMSQLNYYCYLLKIFGRNDLSKNLKRKVISYLHKNMSKIILEMEQEFNLMGYKKDNLFHWYIKHSRANDPLIGLPSLFALLKIKIIGGVSKVSLKTVLRHVKQVDLEKFIFDQASLDSELVRFSKRELIEEILKIAKSNELHSIIQPKIENILLSKRNSSSSNEEQKIYEFVIDNLKKEGLL